MKGLLEDTQNQLSSLKREISLNTSSVSSVNNSHFIADTKVVKIS
jgi:hypothetical protein